MLQGVLQHTPSTQIIDEHCAGVAQSPPFGTSVFVGVCDGVSVGLLVCVRVGVLVGVLVGVRVGVRVAVRVGVRVGVEVGVLVGVVVGVRVGVEVGVGLMQLLNIPPLHVPPGTNVAMPTPSSSPQVAASVERHDEIGTGPFWVALLCD